jgi:hypothetical protein
MDRLSDSVDKDVNHPFHPFASSDPRRNEKAALALAECPFESGIHLLRVPIESLDIFQFSVFK